MRSCQVVIVHPDLMLGFRGQTKENPTWDVANFVQALALEPQPTSLAALFLKLGGPLKKTRLVSGRASLKLKLSSDPLLDSWRSVSVPRTSNVQTSPPPVPGWPHSLKPRRVTRPGVAPVPIRGLRKGILRPNTRKKPRGGALFGGNSDVLNGQTGI